MLAMRQHGVSEFRPLPHDVSSTTHSVPSSVANATTDAGAKLNSATSAAPYGKGAVAAARSTNTV